MRQRVVRQWVLGVVTVLAIATPGMAQTTASLRVSTRLIPPFVIQESNQQLTGFSIDLWQQVAARLGKQSEFQVQANVQNLLQSLREKRADVGVAAISVTAVRERDFDFSHPIFDSGLAIMVRAKPDNSGLGLLTLLLSPALGQLLGLMLILILVPAHIIYFLERKPGGIIEGQGYIPGIFKACWWAAATLSAQADEMPKSPWGRIIALGAMLTSVVFVAYFTATVTTSLTVQQLQGGIRGPEDLPGKRVATTVGSTAATYLQNQRADVLAVKVIDEAYTALTEGRVEAVVFDAPVLLHYTANAGRGRMMLVGSVFQKESYAIALPNGSPYREPINKALLQIQEDGTYATLYQKWFGDQQ
ncbi:extracellular solute-binding protein [Gloeomargarita lithophora Alchichica-D10]|uniref:Extracellular solute-binding protein n=1 Tax=Gloeomargarita lithophora Alchichica-D10 TaxID=1188229 RepID=A0A1J0ADH3_9CYAN|nr:transporter substrate-binding domain-containing protein [Gloeomargarita lithophora]APB33986.1 extracellular solute-binding protein [Gloeomargarita lithophora Alchichica-D10]